MNELFGADPRPLIAGKPVLFGARRRALPSAPPTYRQAKDDPEQAPIPSLLERDPSILAFNERVLSWAERADVPLLERLRFLCIVSSNLDEFFEVRAAPHLTALQNADHKGLFTLESFESVAAKAQELVARQYTIYNEALIPAFALHGIRIVAHGERNGAQRRWVKAYFEREVRPLLVPVALDPAHPFPQVANKSLNFIVRLGGPDAFGRNNDIAIVKVPRALPRLIRMPDALAGTGKAGKKRREQLFVSLSSVIRAHLAELFPGRSMSTFSQFRVTRNSELSVDEDDVQNLRTALRHGLQHRHYGQAVRLEVSAGCDEYLSSFLLRQFELPEKSLYRVHGPVNLVRLNQLIDLVDAPDLLFPAFRAGWPVGLVQGQSFFERLRQGDVMIHQPFESFDAVLAFLREAVNDPQVLAIKQTIYRTGADSELMELLREAVRRGKEVTVVVELKARFDEEANINWAEMLESIGAQVLYGVVGLKTHGKMLLITRREGRYLRRYVHLSTGNYNPRTARLYTDISYLSAEPALTKDVDGVFFHLAGQSRLPRMQRLWMAPLNLHRRLIEKLEQLGAAAAQGLETRVVLKMNALTDEALIHALVRAAQHGVKTDLIVRGACMLPAQVTGATDNIRVRSVIGRMLEHSRVFYFRCNGEEELLLSSADWMNRNMMRRVELAWPVTDPQLRQRIVDECLVAYLHDHRDAWELQASGQYLPVAIPGSRAGAGAQMALMQRYGVTEQGRA